MKRRISGPALELFAKANVSCDAVDQAIEMAPRSTGAVLRRQHELVQAIGEATGVNVVKIARKSRYLLIDVEQRADGGPVWQYREHTPRLCVFSCEGELPATIGIALQGELLEKLVIPAAELQRTVIQNVGHTGEGWLNVEVQPTWHVF